MPRKIRSMTELERMGSIQEFQSMVLNLENKGRMQGKEMGRNELAHRWSLTSLLSL